MTFIDGFVMGMGVACAGMLLHAAFCKRCRHG